MSDDKTEAELAEYYNRTQDLSEFDEDQSVPVEVKEWGSGLREITYRDADGNVIDRKMIDTRPDEHRGQTINPSSF